MPMTVLSRAELEVVDYLSQFFLSHISDSVAKGISRYECDKFRLRKRRRFYVVAKRGGAPEGQ